MNDGWSHDVLGNHVEIVRGLSYTGEGLNGDGLPLHNLDSIREGGGYKRDGIKFYSGSYRERHTVRPGDLLVANTEQAHDRLLIGYPALVPDDCGDTGLFSADLYRVRPTRSSSLDARFLYYLLRAQEYHSKVSNYANGTTVNHLPPEALQRLRIAIPPRSDQEAIANTLSALEQKTERNTRTNATLDALAQAIFDEAVLGATTVTTLAQHLEVTRGLSYASSGLGAGLPLHNLDSIREGGGYSRAGIKYYSGEYRERHVARPGDVLIAMTEQAHERLLIGCPALVPHCFPETTLFSQDLARVRAKRGSPLTSSLIYLLLRSQPLRSKVVAYANGTTVNHLRPVALARPVFTVPDDATLRAVDDRARPLLALVEANEDESEDLTALSDALLPLLVSGHLRPRRGGSN